MSCRMQNRGLKRSVVMVMSLYFNACGLKLDKNPLSLSNRQPTGIQEMKVRRHRCMTCDMSFDIYLTKPRYIIYKSSYCPGQDTYWHTFPLPWRGCWRGGPGEAGPGAGLPSGTCPPSCGTCTILCIYIYLIHVNAYWPHNIKRIILFFLMTIAGFAKCCFKIK